MQRVKIFKLPLKDTWTLAGKGAKNPRQKHIVYLRSIHVYKMYSQISVIRTSIIRNYWVIRRRRTVPTFFSITYCNKTTDYSNFDYPKNSIFRSDSSVPMKEKLLKLPFKIRSPNVTHDDHDFFVWSSWI